MENNLIYGLQVSLAWGVLLIFYYLLLGQVTFFRTNRFYLLSALVVGLILPFIQTMMQEAQVQIQVLQVPMITILDQTPLTQAEKGIDWYSWLTMIYWVGVSLMLLRFIRDLIGVVWLIRSSKKNFQYEGFTIVHLNRTLAPFSFFKYLFVFDKEHFDAEEWKQILLHEQTHINQRHSLDILFTEVLKIIFWWNPLIYWYQRSLREAHEYEADLTAKKNNIKQYGLLLMRQSLSGKQIAIANSFINSQLKKRIMMMTKKRSNPTAILRYVWSLPLLLLLAFVSFGNRVLAQNTPEIAFETMDSIEVIDPSTDSTWIEIVHGIVYKNKNLEKVAILKGCAQAPNSTACTNQKLLTTIMNNVQYPKEARAAGLEGMVVVKALVQGYGSKAIVRYGIVKDPGYGMGAEVIRVLYEADLKWEKALLDGKGVAVQLIIPVKFKLEGSGPEKEAVEKVAPKKENAFSNIRISYDGFKGKVVFDYADGSDEAIQMSVYNQLGDFIDAGLNVDSNRTMKWKTSKPQSFLIIVLHDDHGNKVVRKVAPSK